MSLFRFCTREFLSQVWLYLITAWLRFRLASHPATTIAAWQPPIHPTIRRPTSQTDPEHTNSRQVSSTHTIYSSWPTHASPVCRYCVARTKHRVPVIANVFFYAQIRQYYFACMFILFFSLSRSIPVPGLFFCGDNVCFRVRHILVRVNMRLT